MSISRALDGGVLVLVAGRLFSRICIAATLATQTRLLWKMDGYKFEVILRFKINLGNKYKGTNIASTQTRLLWRMDAYTNLNTFT